MCRNPLRRLPTAISEELGPRRKSVLQIPLWNSVFFVQLAKSRVHENQLRTFYCSRLAHKGFHRVANCVTDNGQILTDLIPEMPKSYRTMYVQKLIQYIDATGGRVAIPRWPCWLEPKELKLSSVLHACTQQLAAEERQTAPLWAALWVHQVPFKLHEFVGMVLWQKLPMTQGYTSVGY